MPTGRTIVTDALDLIMVHAAEEPLTAHQEQQGLRILNDLIQSASLEQFVIYYTPPFYHTWPSGELTQTWGPGGDIPTPRPVQISQEAYRIEGDIVTPVHVVTPTEFRTYAVGVQPRYGPVQCVTYDPAFPLGHLQVWPLPQAPVVLSVYGWQPLTTWPDFDTDIGMPPGYDRYLKSALACELAPYYDKDPSPTVLGMRAESKQNIKTVNLTIPLLQVPWFSDPFGTYANDYYVR